VSKRFANLSERLSADLPADPTRQDDDEEDDTTANREEGPKKKEKPMAENTPVEQTDEYKAGFTAANTRMGEVFASDHYKGREATAHKLLGKDMSSADIIDVLSDTPQATVEVSSDDLKTAREEGARATMQANLEAQDNADLTDAGDTAAKEEVSAKAWDKAIARVFPNGAK
jgi:hypothetical protein